MCRVDYFCLLKTEKADKKTPKVVEESAHSEDREDEIAVVPEKKVIGPTLPPLAAETKASNMFKEMTARAEAVTLKMAVKKEKEKPAKKVEPKTEAVAIKQDKPEKEREAVKSDGRKSEKAEKERPKEKEKEKEEKKILEISEKEKSKAERTDRSEKSVKVEKVRKQDIFCHLSFYLE